MTTESGIPIVLIPGLLNTEDLWHDQVQELSDIGNILVTTEQREYDDIPEIADRILDTAPDRFALAGLSMGGYVAFEILRQAPERVIMLGLLDSSARPDTQEQTAQRQETISKAREEGLNRVQETMLPNLLHPKHLQDQSIVARMFRMAENVGIDAFERQQTAVMNRTDSRSLLPAICCPTLVLCGREDKMTPPEVAKEMADTIPDSRLIIIEESGHVSAIEQPQQVTRAMRAWLTTL